MHEMYIAIKNKIALKKHPIRKNSILWENSTDAPNPSAGKTKDNTTIAVSKLPNSFAPIIKYTPLT